MAAELRIVCSKKTNQLDSLNEDAVMRLWWLDAYNKCIAPMIQMYLPRHVSLYPSTPTPNWMTKLLERERTRVYASHTSNTFKC